jgi:mono/diheme cytochrome c family protein
MTRHGSRLIAILAGLGAVTAALQGCSDASTKPNVDVPISDRAVRGLAMLDEMGVVIDRAGKSNADLEAIGYGQYMVNVGACSGCHNSADGGYLAGGSEFPLGSSGGMVFARNLTPAPVTGLKLTFDQFVEMFRTGFDFRAAAGASEEIEVMPWYDFRWMSVGDMKAIYALLKALPPIESSIGTDDKAIYETYRPVPFPNMFNEGEEDRPLPPEVMDEQADGPDPDNVQRGLAIRPFSAPDDLGARPPDEQNAIGRGSYLVNAVANCSECHTNPSRNFTPGPDYLKVNLDMYLTGGFVFTVPPGLDALLGQERTMSANLSGEQNGYFHRPGVDAQAFAALINGGVITDRSGATRALGFPMPYQNFQKMTPDDLAAVFAYMSTIPARTGSADKPVQGAARYCASDADCLAGESCAVATSECLGPCSTDADCGACQSCSDGRCTAPTGTEICLSKGL